jgi:hypothetical protein
VREAVELDRDGDEGDLAADERDRLAGPEAAEGRRLAERGDVDRGSPDQALEAWLAVRGELLDDGDALLTGAACGAGLRTHRLCLGVRLKRPVDSPEFRHSASKAPLAAPISGRKGFAWASV